MPTDLRLDSRRIGDAAVVAAHGEIDIASCALAESALAAARPRNGALVFDLRGVEFIDTSGLRLVFEERKRAERLGYRFAVVRGPRRVRRLFEIVGLPDGDALFVDDPADVAGGRAA